MMISLMKLKEQLDRVGYIFLSEWATNLSSLELASQIGEVMTFNNVRGYQNISTVQLLKPQKKSEKNLNHYSGVFGFEEFPLHTDLAHWNLPPKYLMLRCLKGVESVDTTLLKVEKILPMLLNLSAHKAIFATRSSELINGCVLPMIDMQNNRVKLLRWDSIFLIPFNHTAKYIKDYMEDMDYDSLKENFNLKEHGDTLIIDNWKVLHGRSSINILDIHREIERIYFKEIY